ncbi:MAG: 50S ribosomal protein L21 [Bauldia sp.]
MFAVIKTGGKQYKVAADDIIRVERVEGAAGDAVAFTEVLMLGSADGASQIGSPTVEGASVTGEVVDQVRTRKVIAFKKRRRKNSRRARGHRQSLTMVRITAVLAAGETAPAKPKRTRKAAAGEAAAQA